MIAGVFAVIILAALVMAIVIPLTILNGWVLSILWGWFAEPLGAPHLSVVSAIGLALIVGLLTGHLKHEDTVTEDEHKIAKVVGLFVAPFATLLFGYVVHCFQ